jgi:hypothetical protein
MESHNQSLTDIVTDLTVSNPSFLPADSYDYCWQAALVNATHKDTRQIRKDIDEAVKQLHVGDYPF